MKLVRTVRLETVNIRLTGRERSGSSCSYLASML